MASNIEVPAHPRAEAAPVETDSLPDGYRVDRDLNLQGMVDGSATVVSGAFLELTGMVRGSLAVEEGAMARVLGVVTGDVDNHGEVEVYGVVGGNVLEHGGRAFIHPDAEVGQGSA